MNMKSCNKKDLPEEIQDIYDQLIVNRKGSSENSFMVTETINGFVFPNTTYTIANSGLIETEYSKHSKENSTQKPPSVSFKGELIAGNHVINIDASILGGLTTLNINQDKINIPIVIATQEYLSYYNAFLYNHGDKINFDTNTILPVSIMNIGKDYLNDYLLKPEFGGGVYLERHDRPHFHMPLSQLDSGYLVLARKDGIDWEMTAFSIPYGHAIYTPPEVWHDDGFLIGRYLVIYTVTEDYTTALLYSTSGNIVNIGTCTQTLEGNG